jgi:hypothetical protein
MKKWKEASYEEKISGWIQEKLDNRDMSDGCNVRVAW